MSNFTRVSQMNEAFGNPKGDPKNIDYVRVRNQVLNIADELAELLIALGANASNVKFATGTLKSVGSIVTQEPDLTDIRDALCDINVFSYGAHHLMGIDADADMDAVIDGVMTRFVKDDADLQATIDMHKAKGITEFYTEAEYPVMVLKSLEDQPDAPKGKFLKSASYQQTVFPPI